MSNVIEVRDLTWQYENMEQPALRSVSIDIEENSFIGVCGPNEAGKTTFVSCLKGLIPNNFVGTYSGKVKIMGKNIKDLNTRELAQYVGFVFADPEAQFTSMSVEEEIAFGLENIGLDNIEIEKRINWVAGITNIEELLDKSPYDISGGQKQRVAIASVLAMQPKVVILDEPTSMLDPIGKDSVFEICKRMKNELNMTIIMVEHTIDRLARLSDKMILINNGTIEKYEKPALFFDDVEYFSSLGLNVPHSIEFMDYLRKHGIYQGEMKTNLQEVIEIAKHILKEKVGVR